MTKINYCSIMIKTVEGEQVSFIDFSTENCRWCDCSEKRESEWTSEGDQNRNADNQCFEVCETEYGSP